MNKQLNTPVLYLIFNRLDTVKQTFEAIRQAKPPRLYIGADGPRENKPGEEKKVKEVREYVLSKIDWDCEVKTLFRDKNLGCGLAPSQAISWFFENEEMGIILEDDILASQSFFWFCEELLQRYKDDQRVGMISGRNSLGIYEDLSTSYCFTTGGGIWGWATWSRVVKEFDYYDNIFTDKQLSKLLNNTLVDKVETKHIVNIFKSDVRTVWDYQWGTFLKINSMLAITPKYNLTRNIGFNDSATHTKSLLTDIDNYEISFPLKNPTYINNDRNFYKRLSKTYIKRNIIAKIINRFIKIFEKLTKFKF